LYLLRKIRKFAGTIATRQRIVHLAPMTDRFVDIHTHNPTGRHLELRTAGIHPWDAATGTSAALMPLPDGVQAIGEIGLDRCCGVGMERQTALLREQLELARACGLPVVLHCVRAFEPLMDELAACEPRAVIFHGFIGSLRQARRAWERGYCLSFGERTFASPRTEEALRAAPPDRLFFETDTSATPIETIYARAAALRGETIEELKQATRINYERIFGTEHD